MTDDAPPGVRTRIPAPSPERSAETPNRTTADLGVKCHMAGLFKQNRSQYKPHSSERPVHCISVRRVAHPMMLLPYGDCTSTAHQSFHRRASPIRCHQLYPRCRHPRSFCISTACALAQPSGSSSSHLGLHFHVCSSRGLAADEDTTGTARRRSTSSSTRLAGRECCTQPHSLVCPTVSSMPGRRRIVHRASVATRASQTPSHQRCTPEHTAGAPQARTPFMEGTGHVRTPFFSQSESCVAGPLKRPTTRTTRITRLDQP